MTLAALALLVTSATLGTSGAIVVDESDKPKLIGNPGRISQEALEKLIPLGLSMADVDERLGSTHDVTKLPDGRVEWFWQPAGGDKNVRVTFRKGKVVERVARWHGIHWEHQE